MAQIVTGEEEAIQSAIPGLQLMVANSNEEPKIRQSAAWLLQQWGVVVPMLIAEIRQGKVELRSVEFPPMGREELGQGINLELVALPGGKLRMGTEEQEIERLCQQYEEDYFKWERPQHQVTLAPFWIGRYPITQEQWRIVAEGEQVERALDPEPSFFQADYQDLERGLRPVENISWSEAQEFCARLSQKTNKNYRLPTEAEWEYACRAGTTTAFHFGETIDSELANYRGTDWVIGDKVYPGHYGRGLKGFFRAQTTPVGYFQVANSFGLYDLHGQVWEWCEDDWHQNYEQALRDGSAWGWGTGNYKVIRGGAWNQTPEDCRSACRYVKGRDDRSNSVGFRVVCSSPKKTKEQSGKGLFQK